MIKSLTKYIKISAKHHETTISIKSVKKYTIYIDMYKHISYTKDRKEDNPPF